MVEHHNERRTVGGGGGDDTGKVRVGEPAHLEHDTLMRPVTGDGVKLCAGDALDVHACLAKAREQLTDSRFALHSLGDEGTLDGKARAQRLECRATALDVVPLCNMDVAASRSRLGLRGSLDIAGLLAAGPDGTLLPCGLLIVTTRRLGAALIDALRFALIVSAPLRALPLCHLGPLRYESFSDIVTSRRAKLHPSPIYTRAPHPGSDAAPDD